MKIIKRKLTLLAILYLFPFSSIFPQLFTIHQSVGKKLDEIIAQYGKPVHLDKSSPSMECAFYQNDTTRMVFVGDEKGVYQVESVFSYKLESAAKRDFSTVINIFVISGFARDTLNMDQYNFNSPGAKISVELVYNQVRKRYDLKVIVKRQLLLE